MLFNCFRENCHHNVNFWINFGYMVANQPISSKAVKNFIENEKQLHFKGNIGPSVLSTQRVVQCEFECCFVEAILKTIPCELYSVDMRWRRKLTSYMGIQKLQALRHPICYCLIFLNLTIIVLVMYLIWKF